MKGVKRYVRNTTSHDNLRPTKSCTPQRSKHGAAGPCVMTGKQAKPVSPGKWGIKVTGNRSVQAVF